MNLKHTGGRLSGCHRPSARGPAGQSFVVDFIVGFPGETEAEFRRHAGLGRDGRVRGRLQLQKLGPARHARRRTPGLPKRCWMNAATPPGPDHQRAAGGASGDGRAPGECAVRNALARSRQIAGKSDYLMRCMSRANLIWWAGAPGANYPLADQLAPGGTGGLKPRRCPDWLPHRCNPADCSPLWDNDRQKALPSNLKLFRMMPEHMRAGAANLLTRKEMSGDCGCGNKLTKRVSAAWAQRRWRWQAPRRPWRRTARRPRP